jgi:glycosyltransferase involved in cell wall biosynthesis
MEERNGWHRTVSAARDFHVSVVYYPSVPLDELKQAIPSDLDPDCIQFVPINDDWLTPILRAFEPCFYAFYRRWHKMAAAKVAELHRKQPFDLAHLVTLCGFREPGFVWTLGIPHIWGPIGGTHNFPSKFYRILSLQDRAREWIRSCINTYQMKHSSTVRNAISQSKVVLAATSVAKQDLEKGFGITLRTELEAGIDYPISEPKAVRKDGGPFRILWAGRLRAWKGLPLLLYAVARLPKSVQVQLRVIGIGQCKPDWQALAKRLGVEDRIEWIDWPMYRETIQHYQWADLFAFTSLRDTSGTGLLEALAAGTPILGLDHQGASDIMDETCAVQIPVTNCDEVIVGFRDGIQRLATDPQEWFQLSQGARKRAAVFHWNTRDAIMTTIYNEVLDPQSKIVLKPQDGPHYVES